MLRLSALLSSLLLSINAFGQINTNVSGFITTTQFSDTEWHDGRSNAALNIDLDYGNWGIRSQISDLDDVKIKRLTLNRFITYAPGHELVIKAGRFPRLDSFHNNSTDTPTTAGLAMLPLAEYNYRLTDSATYTMLDGISIEHTVASSNHLFKTHFDYGRAVINNHCHIHQEAFRTPCVSGYEYDNNLYGYSIGATVERGNWSYLTYRNKLSINTNLIDFNNFTATNITDNYQEIYLGSTNVGIKYNTSKWWVQSEVKFNEFFIKGNSHSGNIVNTKSYYVLYGYKFKDNLTGHIVYNKGMDSDSTSAQDVTVGATYTLENVTCAIEYHKGYGREWMKYFSRNENWNSFVISVTQRF